MIARTIQATIEGDDGARALFDSPLEEITDIVVGADGVIFAAFLHPISSLTPVQIESAVSQVISLVKTFGTTFSSGGLVFPEGRGGEGHSGEEVEDANPPL